MKSALEDVQRRLLENGWLPAGKGEQPWSCRYSRPLIDWTRPFP